MDRSAPVLSSLCAGVVGGVVIIDADGAIVSRNDEATRLLGALEPGANLWAVMTDDLVGAVRSVVEDAGRCGARCTSTAHLRCAGAWCNVVATPAGDVVVIHVIDVTDAVHTEARARALEAEAQRRDEDLNDLLASWGMQVSYVDHELRYTKVFNAPTAYPTNLYLGKRVYEFADNAAGHAITDFQLEVLTSGCSLRREISFHDGLRDRSWLVYGEPILDEDGRRTGVKTVALDVSGMREAEAAATTDYLTGITNRRAMEALVRQETARSLRYGTAASVIVLDIDRFKDVNDIYGHQQGDAVLQELVGRLGEELREADVIARWGGEEFLVLLPEACEDEADHVAERMRRRVADAPFDMVGTITISLGVATTVPGERADELLARADQACLTAKRLGRNRVVAAAARTTSVASDVFSQPLFPALVPGLIGTDRRR